jgi:2-polyprenyl-6-methoxyphenol hydroxylase-like FAD-dependent oxidoreductase
MSRRPTILISGASIAGPALAFWLHRYGWDTTIVERASAFRTGGQNIDIRGAARTVLRRGGLEDAVRDANTGEVGTRFLGAGGRVVAEFPVRHTETAGATAELEILRGDLARILVDSAGSTEFIYGDTISGLTDTGAHVDVEFESGSARQFDLVIAADGIRSSTRRLMFGGDGVAIRPIGMEMTYLTIPRTATDTPWWNWYNEAGGLGITLRPDNHGTTRAVLSTITYGHRRAAEGWNQRRTPEQQRAHLRSTFADVGWETRRVLDALDDADDMYYETLGQVKADRWSLGRLAVTGDAAWCAAPVSGMGTSLSIVGAYVLAGELASHVHHRDAFTAYERIMRPYVEQAQALPPGVPQIANPRSRAGLTVFHTGLRLATSSVVRKIGGRFFTPPADKIDLPDYTHLEQDVR